MIKRVYLGNAIVYQYDLDVSATLVGCSATLPSKVYYGEPLVAALVPDTGYQQLPWNTKVTMGGEDITSTAYDAATNSINITEVTGDVSIEAEAVEMSSDYEPTKFGYKYSQSTSGRFDLGYKATNNTELILDLYTTRDSASLIVGYTNCSVGARPTDNNILWWNYNNSSNSGITVGGKGFNYAAAAKIPSVRFKGYIGQSIFKYEVNGRVTYQTDIGEIPEYTAANNIVLFNRTNANNGSFQGYVYRIIHKESGVVVNEYVPVKIKSSGQLGFYDIVTQTLAKSMSISYWMPGFANTTRHYTNCAATLLSAATTGFATNPVIGSTWSIKITPSSGYTFTGGTTPQVEIDGVDVTSTTVTDNGDGTYTVTIVNVPDKPIEITAACVADPNAVQSNSLLTGTPTNTPDEPMGDNGDEEEM